jgi:16S rRNA A1518/A1519 N6-dimethyltransferase RsmA/KsgA/DIM1 with predicted DNA glycosylase/AP lyase activity
MGVLTQYLVKKNRPLKAVEIDRESVAYLEENLSFLKENIIGEDFLRMDLNKLFDGAQFVTRDNIAQQRVQRSLHQCITDSSLFTPLNAACIHLPPLLGSAKNGPRTS